VSIKEDSNQIREIRSELNHHNIGVITLIAWFWSILQPILNYLPTFVIPALPLPRKVTIMGKAEEAQRSEQEVAELERLAIETLDTQRYRALQAMGMIQSALSSESLQNEDNTSANQSALARPLYRELDKHAEQIIRALHDHHQVYGKAEARLKLNEEGQREAEGKGEKEFWIWAAERV
jgi:hypothetical protein